jgi:hypothetical protein
MDHTYTTFNDFIGNEDLNTEFKEFSFHNSDLVLSNQLAESYCHNYRFDFNLNVLTNVNRYIERYLPKYTCAFLNINVEGTLYFGVNDYGFVKGIPFQGDIPINTIKKRVFDIIQTNIKNPFGQEVDLNKLISVDIIKINNPPEPTKAIPQTFSKFLDKKKIYIKAYNDFIKKNNKWKVRFNYFSQKLVDLVNNEDSRDMIIVYIRNIDPTCNVISMLESDYILEYKCHDEVISVKTDPTNPYYWVCKWRDDMIRILKKSKPIFEVHDFYPIIPYNLIISTDEMIPYWIHNNQSMNLYLIKINFKTLNSTFKVKTSSKQYFSYFRYDDNKLISCYRNILHNGDPVCTPY